MKKLMAAAMVALMMLALSAPVALAKDNDGGNKGNGNDVKGNNSASADRNDLDGVTLISVDDDDDFDRDDFDGIDFDSVDLDDSDLDIDYDLDVSDWQVALVDLNGDGVIDELEYQIALSSL